MAEKVVNEINELDRKKGIRFIEKGANQPANDGRKDVLDRQ